MKEKKKLTPTQKLKRKLTVAYSLLGVSLVATLILSFFLFEVSHTKPVYVSSNEPINIPTIEPTTKPEPVEKPTVKPEPEPTPVDKPIQKPTVKPTPVEKPVVKPPIVPEPVKGDRPKIVFVIDDCGLSLNDLDNFLKIPYKVTFAVMPHRTYSKKTDEILFAKGQEIILHQPMEPSSSVADPGIGAILTTNSKNEIWTTLNSNFNSVPHAKGLNNHMGSKATADLETMIYVNEYLLGKNKFFLDSRTIATTKVAEAADKIGVKWLTRNGRFLDNSSEKAKILAEINSGLKTAKENGSAILIGHLKSAALAELLIEIHPQLIKAGFEITDLQSILEEKYK